MMVKTICWEEDRLMLLDQTKLPWETSYYICTGYRDVIYAIKNLIVRGAPAIGVAAAFGMALAAREFCGDDLPLCRQKLSQASDELAASRPTAVNLFWALDRMKTLVREVVSAGGLFPVLLEEARTILQEDLEVNKRIGSLGVSLIPEGAAILTHCNAGALATGGYGTALGVIRAAREAGKKVRVYAGETRPLLQGARLTVFELMEEKIPVTLITDNMAGYLMQKGLVDLVLVGADRITARGDVANKIGTYSLAVLASAHGIPFYVAAPVSTFDLTLSSGEEIPIEERDGKEVREICGHSTAPPDVPVLNPAFDLTPHRLVSAIITEKGTIKKPDADAVRRCLGPGTPGPVSSKTRGGLMR